MKRRGIGTCWPLCIFIMFGIKVREDKIQKTYVLGVVFDPVCPTTQTESSQSTAYKGILLIHNFFSLCRYNKTFKMHLIHGTKMSLHSSSQAFCCLHETRRLSQLVRTTTNLIVDKEVSRSRDRPILSKSHKYYKLSKHLKGQLGSFLLIHGLIQTSGNWSASDVLQYLPTFSNLPAELLATVNSLVCTRIMQKWTRIQAYPIPGLSCLLLFEV